MTLLLCLPPRCQCCVMSPKELAVHGRSAWHGPLATWQPTIPLTHGCAFFSSPKQFLGRRPVVGLLGDNKLLPSPCAGAINGFKVIGTNFGCKLPPALEAVEFAELVVTRLRGTGGVYNLLPKENCPEPAPP